ncbi:MAG TPA: class I SAM-dependent methyltransferase [Terriglobales bacterium]|nr:class I SAM-dependent methyltransferase [Terriglobales bacterium]
MANLRNLIGRTVRYLAPARSKERSFSADIWNNSWSHGYDLNILNEDARYGVVVAWMRRYERNGPLLDVGCGDGLLEERYRKVSTTQIIGFDYSSIAIERARARCLNDVEFLCADGRTFLPKRRFSVVVLNESLYYVDDYLGVMANLSRALIDDGVFIVSMHDTRVTRRIWKNVQRSYVLLHGAALRDETTDGFWRVRLLRPRRWDSPQASP